MKELELDAEGLKASDIGYRFQHLLVCLARQSQDNVSNYRDLALREAIHRILEACQGKAAADEAPSLGMDGLQPQLYPYGLYLVQLFQEGKDVFRQAVRACGNG